MHISDADTLGRSPKAVLAGALTASLGTIASILIAWLVAGVELDRAGLAGAVTGLVLAAIAYAGAYLASTGTITLPDSPPPSTASDVVNRNQIEPPAGARVSTRT